MSLKRPPHPPLENVLSTGVVMVSAVPVDSDTPFSSSAVVQLRPDPPTTTETEDDPPNLVHCGAETLPVLVTLGRLY